MCRFVLIWWFTEALLLCTDRRVRIAIWSYEEHEESLCLYFLRIRGSCRASYCRVTTDSWWKRSRTEFFFQWIDFTRTLYAVHFSCTSYLWSISYALLYFDLFDFNFSFWKLCMHQLGCLYFFSQEISRETEGQLNKSFQGLGSNFEGDICSRYSTLYHGNSFCLCCSFWT